MSSFSTGAFATCSGEEYKLRFSKDPSVLQTYKREKCPRCKTSKRFFCYICKIPMGDPNAVPKVKLPLRCVVLQHPNECKSKSTAIHAAVLSDDVTIYEFPEVPEFDVNKTLLLYPTPGAKSMEQILKATTESYLNVSSNSSKDNNENSSNNASDDHRDDDDDDVIRLDDIDTVVFIDSTWQQSKAIYRDARVNKLKHVMINSQKTKFWRYQEHGEEYLSTVEAIYHFYREWQTARNYAAAVQAAAASSGLNSAAMPSPLNWGDLSSLGQYYHGEFDDLLFYYEFMFDVITERYNPNSEASKKKNPDEAAAATSASVAPAKPHKIPRYFYSSSSSSTTTTTNTNNNNNHDNHKDAQQQQTDSVSSSSSNNTNLQK